MSQCQMIANWDRPLEDYVSTQRTGEKRWITRSVACGEDMKSVLSGCSAAGCTLHERQPSWGRLLGR